MHFLTTTCFRSPIESPNSAFFSSYKPAREVIPLKERSKDQIFLVCVSRDNILSVYSSPQILVQIEGSSESKGLEIGRRLQGDGKKCQIKIPWSIFRYPQKCMVRHWLLSDFQAVEVHIFLDYGSYSKTFALFSLLIFRLLNSNSKQK